MDDQKRSALYEIYLADGTKVWVNLGFVVSARLIKPEDMGLAKDDPLTLRVHMVDGTIYDIGNDHLDHFLFALRDFYNQ